MNDDKTRSAGQPAGSERAPEELRRALERLSLALSATGLGVWERDIATNTVTWSETMHRLFGRSDAQFSGSPDEVLSFVHPDDRADFRSAYEAAVRGEGDSFEQEFRIVRSDGAVRWVYRRGQLRRGADGRAHSILGVAFDITERKQAEDANARLAAIASAADDAIMGLSPDGTILAWNPAAERMFGYPATEIIGRSARILYPADAEAEFTSLYARVRTGEYVRYESVRVRKDGTPVDVSGTATPVVGRMGRVVGVSAVVRDVGERKRTEQKLGETLALLLQTNNQRKLALLAGRMGTFEVDLAGGAITWSDEIYEQVGIDRATPVRTMRDIARFIHPDDRQAVARRRSKSYRSGEPYDNEFRIVRPDGQVRWLYVRAQPLPAGKPERVYGVSMDVTERKHTVEALARERELLQTTIDTIPVMITLHQPDAAALRLNRAFEQALGWTSSEAAGLSLMEAIYPDPARRAKVRDFMQSGEPGWMDVTMTARDGHTLEASWASIKLSDGSQVGIGIDISERKEREAQIRLLMSEVSHRSKNLLAVVQAIASQTARATRSPTHFAADFGARLKSLASSLDLLVRQEWRGVSAHELVQSQLGHYADPSGKRVQVEGPDLLLTPSAAQYLGMALHELSTNAVKYGALSVPGGKVRIQWRLGGRRGAKRLRMSWVESGGPKVSPPEQKGFGHMVIERMAAEALQGKVELEFKRDGVRWTLDAKADAAIKQGGDGVR